MLPGNLLHPLKLDVVGYLAALWPSVGYLAALWPSVGYLAAL